MSMCKIDRVLPDKFDISDARNVDAEEWERIFDTVYDSVLADVSFSIENNMKQWNN